ncbi:MAG: DUF4198 domain-containing protein [Desulfobacterales bacterium]|nr:DUF4198 domain-containing protein [Desulfobacterales bacterium]
MRFVNKILILMLPVLLSAMPAFGHHLWVSADNGNYTVNRGIISERTDTYDPACVQAIKAWNKDGKPLSVHRINKDQQVQFKTQAPAALIRVVSEWGNRVNTTRGKKLMDRKQAEKAGLTVISAFFSTQFAKTLLIPSEQNLKPLGMKFEILPQQSPLSTEPGQPISFKVLFEGKPLENTAVYTQADRAIRTDANGTARIAFAEKGVHLLYAKHQVPDQSNRQLDYQKFMTFLTFEVR